MQGFSLPASSPIAICNIIRCESSNAYTSFYIATREKIVVSKPIYEYDELLSDFGFIRCHQSHLVNKEYIRSWRKGDGGYLELQNGDEIPVSKSKKDVVTNLLTYLK